MSHNRNSGFCNCFYLRADILSSLKFHGTGSSLFHQAAGIYQCIIYGCLIRHKRHVDDYQCILCTSCHGYTMMYHIFHGHGYGIFISQYDISKGISHQNTVNSGFIHQFCRGIIICRKHGKMLAVLFCIFKSYC